MAIAGLVVAIVAALAAAAGLALGIRNDKREKARVMREEEQAIREARQQQLAEETAARARTADPHGTYLGPAQRAYQLEGYTHHRYNVMNAGGATALDLHLELIDEQDTPVAEFFVDHLKPEAEKEVEITLSESIVGPLRVRFWWWSLDHSERLERVSGAKAPPTHR